MTTPNGPVPNDCDDTPKLTAAEWAYVEQVTGKHVDDEESPGEDD